MFERLIKRIGTEVRIGVRSVTGQTAYDADKPTVLNVGGHDKGIAISARFDDWNHLLLDIDPAVDPDVVCDARQMALLRPAIYDAIYCAHNLEHFYRHDVQHVLRGFLHVLKADGFAEIHVPDIEALMHCVVRDRLDIDDVLYESAAGPITVQDVLYGLGSEIERSGQDFFAHKTGFSRKSLSKALHSAGFQAVFIRAHDLEINAVAFKAIPADKLLQQLGLAEFDFA